MKNARTMKQSKTERQPLRHDSVHTQGIEKEKIEEDNKFLEVDDVLIERN
jgi:hypothetical protein